MSVAPQIPRRKFIPPAVSTLNTHVILGDEISSRRQPSAVLAPPYRKTGAAASTYNQYELNRAVIRIARRIYKACVVKKVAQAMAAPIATANHWVHNALSSARCRELAEKLLVECDEEIRRRIKDRGELCSILGIEDEVGSRVGNQVAASGHGETADADPLLAAARWLAEKARQ